MIYSVIENTLSSVKKIYNSKLTINKNMKSSTLKRSSQSIENTVDLDQRVNLVKLRSNEGF